MSIPSIHLASSSPRRHDLLATLGLRFTAAGVDVDERRLGHESPSGMVERLAALKAETAVVDSGTLVLGADTAVVLGDRVFGKPADRDDACAMLAALSGRTHEVMTGVALRGPDGTAVAVSVTEVEFREIRPDEALRYWQSGEPEDKAGAYAIQGIGGVFVRWISGSYSGVVGLPVFETAELLRAAGLDVFGPAAPAGRGRAV
jgi:septum formation protein